MLNLPFLILVLLTCVPKTESVDVCIPGFFLYTPKQGPDICLACYPKTFMPYHLHTYRQCFECSHIQDPQLEILVEFCNTQQVTNIECIDGYFRTNPAYPGVEGQCQKCKQCPFVKTPCLKNRDSVCCPDEDYAVRVNIEGNPECVRLCGPGQFLDPDNNECLPCPAGTHMDEINHMNIYCKNCDIPRYNYEIIVQPCDPIEPAIIGCVDGYYRRSPPYEGCAKCQVCSESTTGHVCEVRPCNVTHNTVCGCPPDMIEVDTPGGPQCQHPMTAAPSPVENQEMVSPPAQESSGNAEYLNMESSNTQTATSSSARTIVWSLNDIAMILFSVVLVVELYG